jgi:hypothetical protein
MVTVLELKEASGEAFRHRLPAWFIDRFRVPPSEAELDEWLRHWRTMPPSDREVASREQWTLEAWLAALDPAERQWHWWDARVRSDDLLEVVVLVDGMPAGFGALDFLLYASGATAITNDG